jgi:hypothetical protein
MSKELASTFTGLTAIAQQFSQVSTGIASIGSDVVVGRHLDGMMPTNTIYAYTPLEFSTLVKDGRTSLQSIPYVSEDASPAVLPPGSILRQATVEEWTDQYGNSGNVLPANAQLIIGTADIQGNNPATKVGRNLFNGVAGGAIHNNTVAMTASSQAFLGAAIALSAPTPEGWWLTIRTSETLTNGSLKIAVSYQLKPGPPPGAVV